MLKMFDTNLILFCLISIFIGLIVGAAYKRIMYGKILLLCAKGETPEKLRDGKFYCLIPEKDACEYHLFKFIQSSDSKFFEKGQ